MIARYRDGVVPDVEVAPVLNEEFEGLRETVCARLDAIEITVALDEVWQRVKRLNRYVQEEEPWQLAKDEGAADRLDQALYSLAEGLRVVSVLLHPFMPGSAERLLAALGQPDLSLERAQLGAVGGGASIGDLGQLFPRLEPLRRSRRSPSAPRPDAARVGGRRPADRQPVIDTHCHLDHCDGEAADWSSVPARPG